jgi:predicted Zn-dependent protease
MIDTDRALAPLNAVSAAIDKLETYRTPQELAESLQAIGQAVERSLRQLLRADTSAPDELRLSALSPEDLPMDRLIPALRKHDLISLQLAGMVHELQQAVVRSATNDVRAADADNARATVRRLNEDIHARADAPMREAATAAVVRGDIEEAPHPVTTNRGALRGARAVLPIALLVGLGLIIWAVMHFAMGGSSAMTTGINAFQQQRWGVAEQNFRLVLKDHPADPTASVYLGRVLRVEGRPKDAAVVLNDARKKSPKDPDILRELGGVFMDLNQPGAAVDAYKQARDIDPKTDANWVGLVLAMRAAGDPAAEAEMQRAPSSAQEKLRSQP